VVSDSWLAGVFRTRILARIAAFALGREPIQKFAFRVVSQTGIRYRNSALSTTLAGLPDAGPRAGDRFPWLRLKFRPDGPVEDAFEKLDDRHFNLIVIGEHPGEGAPDLGGLMRTHAVPIDSANQTELARAGIPQPSFYLVRPDGHVGLCGNRLEAAAVKRYVAESLRLVFEVGDAERSEP
jgi:hypothetical protein